MIKSGGAVFIGRPTVVEGLSLIVRSTISMCSMLMLGGSGGMPPRKLDALRLNLGAFPGHKPAILYICKLISTCASQML